MGANKTIFRRGTGETSLTASDLGTPGELRIEPDSRQYRLVSVGSAVATADGPQMIQLDSVSASVGYVVEPAHSSLVPLYGVYNATAALATGAYFWCMVRGSVGIGGVEVGSDVSMAANIALMFNTDVRLETVRGIATGAGWAGIVGQNIGASRASDAASTVTQAVYVVGLGAG